MNLFQRRKTEIKKLKEDKKEVDDRHVAHALMIRSVVTLGSRIWQVKARSRE